VAEEIALTARVPLEAVQAREHLTYFEEYLGHLKPATILVEREYVDLDFLEDFAGYYAQCFSPYPSKCSRLHCFSVGFSEADFADRLKGAPSALTGEGLAASYLGYVVVKPLPRTAIG